MTELPMTIVFSGRFLRRLVVGVAAILGLLLAQHPASASQELREALHDLAVKIKKVLAGEGATAVAIGQGQFTGPTTVPTASGPAIRQLLTEELLKIGIKVKDVADFGLKG